MKEHHLHLAITTGELLLRNGAEISRVEQTISYMARYMGAMRVDCFVTPTGMIISLVMAEETHTLVRRITSRSYNLAAVMELNDLSRRFCNGEIPAVALAERLDNLSRPIPAKGQNLKMSLASGLGSLGFSLISGLRLPLALAYATINGAVVRYTLDYLTDRIAINSSLAVLLSSTLLTTLTFFYPGLDATNRNLVNMGGLFLLLPGVTLTTSFRDLANGDLLTGVSRLAEALLSLTLVAAGVIVSFTIWPWLQEVLLR
ncbi:MAG: threonine/serine exporter family protein [Symbiobacteriaceae bacterium]|nr:threonine/serine exporter family protein [Symbiobacteriaceae bacterium]